MTTLVRLAKRSQGLSTDDFQRQAGADCDWSSAVPYGLRAATQALTLAGAYRRGEPACDAIDELVFDDEASVARCLADAAFRRAWASELLDPASVACLVVEEHVAKPGPVPAAFVKSYELVTKRPDLARADFDEYWARVHGPLAATIPTIRRYVQAHLSPGTREAGTAPLDGLAITWFDDVAAMRAGTRTEAYAKTRADERNFLAGELPFVITTERGTFPRAGLVARYGSLLGCSDRTVQSSRRSPVTKRWVHRPEGSTWGDWGEDDELGRINLITSEKVLEGVREVQAGKSFCLSLPLDFPGGSSLNQRRYPPIIRPTEDLAYKPDTFYNVVARDSISPEYVDVWSDDMVTLWTQYSTQWDALVHQGALFDADGDGVDEPLYYNGFKPHVDIIGPKEDAKGDGSGSVAFARHLGLEHMAAHGVQGRAVLIDVAHHLNNTEDWVAVPMKTVREIMAADKVEVRPGDMVIIHTGFTEKILEWDKNPDASRIQAMYPYLDGEDPEVLEWITDSRMSALIADNYAVEGWPAPSPEPHTLIPVHNLCLFKLGIPLGEMWYTQELATWLRANGRSSFLLTAPPLRLPGTAGGPLNPIATV